LVALLALLIAAVAVRPAPATADAAAQGGDFVAFPTPSNALDTRDGTGGVTGKRGAASVTTFPVLGVGAVPASGVSAVLVRLATVAPTAATFLELWPDGVTRPDLSMLAVGAGEEISNTAVVKPGANGRIAVYNNAGSTHVVAQIQGYFRSSAGGAGGGFVPVAHTRFADTRSGLAITTGTIGVNVTRTVTFTGSLVPAGASGVFVSLLVPGASAAGRINAAPAGTTATHATLNYTAGSTASGVALKLSANGQAAFTNKGTVAVNLVVVLEGYFTATTTTGAGYRQVANRLINTRTEATEVPAGATIDVVVAGSNGLPTRGVAGALLNLTVTSPAKAGSLRAWPVGQAEPAVTQMDFKAGLWRSALAVIKPGTDGKIRIRNGSDGLVNVIVDLQGWFADPIPAAPIVAFAPTTALQGAPATSASLGTMEYAYTDNIGRVVQGHQSDLDNFGSVQWTVISGNEAFSGQPALSVRSDNRTQVAAQYGDSDVWAASQTATGAATWTAWSDLGGSMAAPPAMAKLSTGVTVVFAVDADGRLWVYAQTGRVPFWRNLGDQDLVGTPTVVAIRNGLQLFARDTAGAIRTAQYVDGALSAWTDLGGAGATSTPSVVVYPGYRLRVFVRAADGTIASKAQDTTGAFPAAWDTLGAYVSGGAPAAILDPIDGRTAVVTRDPAGAIYVSWETVQGSGAFGDWSQAIDIFDPAATDPTVAPLTNSNGQSWVIVFRNANNAGRVYVRQPAPATLTTFRSTVAGGFAAHTLPAPPA